MKFNNFGHRATYKRGLVFTKYVHHATYTRGQSKKQIRTNHANFIARRYVTPLRILKSLYLSNPITYREQQQKQGICISIQRGINDHIRRGVNYNIQRGMDEHCKICIYCSSLREQRNQEEENQESYIFTQIDPADFSDYDNYYQDGW